MDYEVDMNKTTENRYSEDKNAHLVFEGSKGATKPIYIISGSFMAAFFILPISKGYLGSSISLVWYLTILMAILFAFVILKNSFKPNELKSYDKHHRYVPILQAVTIILVLFTLTVCNLQYSVGVAMLFNLCLVGGIIGSMYPEYNYWMKTTIHADAISLYGRHDRHAIMQVKELDGMAKLDIPSDPDSGGYLYPYWGSSLVWYTPPDVCETRLALLKGKEIYYLSLSKGDCKTCIQIIKSIAPNCTLYNLSPYKSKKDIKIHDVVNNPLLHDALTRVAQKQLILRIWNCIPFIIIIIFTVTAVYAYNYSTGWILLIVVIVTAFYIHKAINVFEKYRQLKKLTPVL